MITTSNPGAIDQLVVMTIIVVAVAVAAALAAATIIHRTAARHRRTRLATRSRPEYWRQVRRSCEARWAASHGGDPSTD